MSCRFSTPKTQRPELPRKRLITEIKQTGRRGERRDPWAVCGGLGVGLKATLGKSQEMLIWFSVCFHDYHHVCFLSWEHCVHP